MRRPTKTLILIIAIATLGMLAMGVSAFFLGQGGLFNRQANVDDIIADVLANRAGNEDGVAFGNENEINVLVIGLDQRKSWDKPHCDAIHMFTLDIENWDITITSVPRGTYAYIPLQLAETEYYVSNTCSYISLEYGIAQIEKIAGVKADYYATVNFSQVIGILRMFDMPTTESLQWLRHRQSYAIGDPQRSHNQAVFMKDLVLNQLKRFRGDFALPVQFVLYNFVNTDMDFEVARALLNGYVEARIDERPQDITLRMRPHHDTVDYHFDVQNPQAQIEELLRRIRPYLSSEDLSGRSLESIQTELVLYLEDRLAGDESMDDVFERQLWLQVEDAEKRESLHYRFVEEQVFTLIDDGSRDKAIDLLTAYIIEMNATGQSEYEEKGRGLMRFIVE